MHLSLIVFALLGLSLINVSSARAIKEKRQILPCLPYPYCTTGLTTKTTATTTKTTTTTTPSPTTTTTTTTKIGTPTTITTSTTSATGIISSATAHPTATPGAWQTFTASGSSVQYKVYTPSKYSSSQKVPLIMMLHGCTQNMNIFSDSTQYAGLAEAQNFIVVFPSQATSVSESCWKWYDPTSQQRGGGDAAVLADIVTSVKENGKWNIDSSRVYVGGLSAGAAMAVVMGATYPDYFTAIAVGSGLEYGAGTSASTLSLTQGGPAPATQGQAAFNAMASYDRSVPVLVFHGTGDYTVYPLNGDQVVEQYLTTDKLAAPNSGLNTAFGGGASSTDHGGQDITGSTSKTSGSVSGGYTYTVYTWNDNAGARIQYYKIDTMAHAWSGGYQVGSATFVDPKGPDASLISYNFFMNYSK
ncbi:hypothetical protein NQZ79_g2952 [Umbelopsis isabellina]|nr:hypothetical protein NQZ79_g2952 [Umbelopsis isabellina]